MVCRGRSCDTDGGGHRDRNARPDSLTSLGFRRPGAHERPKQVQGPSHTIAEHADGDGPCPTRRVVDERLERSGVDSKPHRRFWILWSRSGPCGSQCGPRNHAGPHVQTSRHRVPRGRQQVEALQAKVEALSAHNPQLPRSLKHGHDVTAADIEALASDDVELSDWEAGLAPGRAGVANLEPTTTSSDGLAVPLLHRAHVSGGPSIALVHRARRLASATRAPRVWLVWPWAGEAMCAERRVMRRTPPCHATCVHNPPCNQRHRRITTCRSRARSAPCS